MQAFVSTCFKYKNVVDFENKMACYRFQLTVDFITPKNGTNTERFINPTFTYPLR